MTRSLVMMAIGATVCCLDCSSLAESAGASKIEPVVTPELVCSVAHSYRRRSVSWSFRECRRVAEAMANDSEPEVLLAIAVLESDMRPTATSREFMRNGQRVVDVGLMGIRCVKSRAGVCTNGRASGLTVRRLQDPAVNVAVASRILDDNRRRLGAGYLRAYNGNADGSNGYGEKVGAIVGVLRGRRVEVKSLRVQKLVEQIASAVANERRS